jgi:F0F1-type ATP synthase assembly protein I
MLPFTPETLEETTRKSGLAYGAGLTLFGFVLVMFLLGLGFDYYFGSSPKGVVGGIILGAISGFYMFFRITSQIIKNK